MKLLLVTPYFRDSFAGKISMGSAVVAAEQLSLRHDVTVLTTGRALPLETVSPRLRVRSVSGWLLPDPVNYVVSPAALRETARFVRRERPQAVVVSKFMFFTSFAAVVAKALGVPVVVVTDTYPGINWFPRSRLVAAVMWLYARVVGVPLLRLADRVVVLHEGLAEEARRRRLRVQVIHNGVSLERADAAEPAEDLQKPEGETWVGYLGRLESVKGWDVLLAAFDSLRERHPRLRVVFVGGRRPEGFPESDRVRFLGFRADVFAVLKRMDVFCLPSFSEGLPNALMEAMATGRACVASGVGGVLSLLEHERSGLLVPPGDPAALAAALERLLLDEGLRRRLGSAARETVAARFDVRLMTEAWESLLAELIGAPDQSSGSSLRSGGTALPSADRSSAGSPPRPR